MYHHAKFYAGRWQCRRDIRPRTKKTNPTKSILALRLPDKNGTKILHIINQLEYWS